MSPKRVYLDYAATTPIDARVVQAMLPHLQDTFGNPSSVHHWGQQAESVLESSRHLVAQVLGCTPSEIIFTAGGSESDNLALRGAAFAARASRSANRILTTPVEHPAVLGTAEQLATLHGFDLEILPVDSAGWLAPATLAARIAPDVAVASVIYANNEIGTINPIAELGEICRRQQIPLHTDAVQAASQLSVDTTEILVDLMSLGAHKFYGPKGVGVLFVRQGTPLVSALTGGSQESGLRAGTPNTPLIAGLAEALRITVEERDQHNNRYRSMRDRLIDAVLQDIPDSRLTGHPSRRMPNHASFVFQGIDGNQLLAALDLAGFACSSGSACKTGDPEPSYVLQSLALDSDWALGSLRVTLGRQTMPADIDAFTVALPEVIARLRSSRLSGNRR